MHAHNVYFSLNDTSSEKIGLMIADAHKYLAPINGIVSFACGVVEDSLDRPISDRDWDVGLHVLFTDLAAHDAYQIDPLHDQFVARNKENWARVRVFDTATRDA